VNCIENIFDSTIARPVRSTKHNAVTSFLDELYYNRMFVDILIIHGQTKGLSRTIDVLPHYSIWIRQLPISLLLEQVDRVVGFVGC
jgi:hypothetical protein